MSKKKTRSSSSEVVEMDDDLLFILGGMSSKTRNTLVESVRDLCLGFTKKWKLAIESNRRNEAQTVLLGLIYLLEQSEDSASLRSGKNAALVLVQMLDFDLIDKGTRTRLVSALCLELLRSDQFLDEEVAQHCSFTSSSKRISDVACATLVHLYEKEAFLGGGAEGGLNLQAVVDYCGNASNDFDVRIACVERLSIGNTELSARIAQNEACYALLLRGLEQDLNSTAGPGLAKYAAIRALINVTNHLILPLSSTIPAQLVPIIQTKLSQLILKRDERWDFDLILLLLTLLANLVEMPENGVSVLCDWKLLCDLFNHSLPARIAHNLAQTSSSDSIEFSWTPEELVLSSHVCLVLGCLVRDLANTTTAVTRLCQDLAGGKKRGFAPQVQILQTFLDFQNQAGVMTMEMQDSVAKVASYFIQANQKLMLPPPVLLGRRT